MARVFGHPTRTLAAVLGVLQGTVCVKAQDIPCSTTSRCWWSTTSRCSCARSAGMPTHGNGLISVPKLMAYMSELLPLLTQDNGERIASMEVRFQNALFVSGSVWCSPSNLRGPAIRVRTFVMDHGLWRR